MAVFAQVAECVSPVCSLTWLNDLRHCCAVGAGGSCVEQTHSIYYDQALQPLTKIPNVNDSAGCCAECLEFQPVGAGGGGKLCNTWTFCGPGGSCTLSGEVASPPQWTTMAVGDCVLLNWPTARTGQFVVPHLTAQKTSSNLSYWTGARPVLLSVSRSPNLLKSSAALQRAPDSVRACRDRLQCIWVVRNERAQLEHFCCRVYRKPGDVWSHYLSRCWRNAQIHASVKDRLAGTCCGREPPL